MCVYYDFLNYPVRISGEYKVSCNTVIFSENRSRGDCEGTTFKGAEDCFPDERKTGAIRLSRAVHGYSRLLPFWPRGRFHGIG